MTEDSEERFFSGFWWEFSFVEGVLDLEVSHREGPTMSREDLPPGVFDDGPGSTKSFGMLVYGCLGMLDFFPLWILLKGGGLN